MPYHLCKMISKFRHLIIVVWMASQIETISSSSAESQQGFPININHLLEAMHQLQNLSNTIIKNNDKMDAKIEDIKRYIGLQESIANMDRKIVKLGSEIEDLKSVLGRMNVTCFTKDGGMDTIDTKLENILTKIENMETKVGNLESKIGNTEKKVVTIDTKIGLLNPCYSVSSLIQRGSEGVDAKTKANQQWLIKIVGTENQDVLVEVKSKLSDKCVDNENNSFNDGNKVQQFTCSGHGNSVRAQRYIVVPMGLHFSLKNIETKKCIGVSYGSLDNLAKLVQWPCGEREDQLWEYNKGRLVNKWSEKCIVHRYSTE